MWVETYVWLWMHFDAKLWLRKMLRRLGLALLFIVPLLYLNIDLIKKGYRPSQTGLTIRVGQTGGDAGNTADHP